MSTTRSWPSQGIVNVTTTPYLIPQAGDLNWAALTDFLVALAEGAQSTTFQRFANRTATSSPVNVTQLNDCVVCTNLTVPGPVSVLLPAGVDKQVFIISDNKGDAVTNNVTISPFGVETIGGAPSYVMATNNQAVMLVFEATTSNWNIAGQFVPNPSGGSVGGFTPNISIISDGAGNLTSSGTTATEIGYVAGVTSSIQTQLNNKQPLDADLTALAALTTTGFATRTGAGTWDTRTFSAGSSKITVTNGDGIAGAPVIDAVEANFTLNNIGGTLSIAKGGTSVTSVTTTPTPTAFAGWDANSNLSANAFIPGYATTATSGGTTTLVVGSRQLQYFTGTLTHTVTLPVVSTLVLGQSFHIVNSSTQNVTVNSSGGNLVQTMGTGSSATYTVILTSGTTAASWNVEYSTTAAGTVTSVNVSGGTTGLTTSGGPVTTSGTITLAGTLIAANGGTGLTAGTSGGILGFTGTTTIASSALLTANQLVIGGGAGATPSTLAAGTSGQILRMNATPIPAWTTIPSPTTQKFTSGSGTYTAAAGVKWIQVEMIGGGGGGAAGFNSGGSSTQFGGNGGNTTFGSSFLTANGGTGGQFGSVAGGTATIGAGAAGTALTGATGGGAWNNANLNGPNGTGAMGASTPFGGGAPGISNGVGSAAVANTGAGGGGGGYAQAATGANSGGGGAAGGYIKAVVSPVSATYAYAIGSAGTGGPTTGSSGGQVGGAGGSGYIIVTEYYI